MVAFKILSILSLFLYSTVSAATVPAAKIATCGVQVTPVCADWHNGCQDALSLISTSKKPEHNLVHITLPGDSKLYQSNDNLLSVQANEAPNFVGRATIQLKSSREEEFNAAVIFFRNEDGKAHGITYKLPAKTAGDQEFRYCHHQLPRGFKAGDVQMIQAV
jgi:hypothetical protein